MTSNKDNIKEIFKELIKIEVEKCKIYENIVKFSESLIDENILIETARKVIAHDSVSSQGIYIEVSRVLGVNIDEPIENETINKVEDKNTKIKEEINKEEEEKIAKLKKEIQEEEDKQVKKDLESSDYKGIAERLGMNKE